MVNRLVSVGDDFKLPTAVKVENANLPANLQPAALSATYGPDAPGMKAAFLSGIVLSGPGIDPTGVAISTAAVQAKLDTAATFGASVDIPAGAEINLDNELVINGRIALGGRGLLKWTAGIAGKPAIRVMADGCVLEGVRMINPNELGNKTVGSARPYGILIEANDTKVTLCHIELFQNSIAEAATGEFHDNIISKNRVKDCLGAGGGASSASADGEDRGDGILSWGASTVIDHNIINAKPGTDARIGAHVEGLSPYGADWLHRDKLATIGGNIVYGPFRRGIVNESVGHVTISDNVVADATWWAIALIAGAHYSTVTGNTILWTRTSTDNHGSAWAPKRGGVMVHGDNKGSIVSNNTIEVAVGANMPFAYIAQAVSATERAVDLSIQDNKADDPNGVMSIGVFLDNYSDRVKVKDNEISGFTLHGVYGYRATDPVVRHNRLTGIAAAPASTGVKLEASATPADVSVNIITDCLYGVNVPSRGGSLRIKDNDIRNATVGIDTFGASTVASDIAGNLFTNVTTRYQNYSHGTRSVQLVWDPISLAPGTGETSADIAVPGAALGDFVLASASVDVTGLTVTAYVASAGIVRIRIANSTAAAVDRGSATWRVRLLDK